MPAPVASSPVISAASLSIPLRSLSKAAHPLFKPVSTISVYKPPMNNLFNRLGYGSRSQQDPSSAAIAQGPDDDVPSPGQQFAQFGAGCFWGLELAYQRVPGVTKTEVGVQYDPKECSFENLLDVFWKRHDPTTLNRQGNDVGTQYRSGIYYYTDEQEKLARESLEKQEKILNKKIVTELLPARKFYRAEEYHQQYLAKGGSMGRRQSAEKGCNDPIRCYG
ncbi:hypothetical protein HID58_078166 [Brassica napus]|uniref:peptide-methionine (S)-S-oxide reductase n=1 Tax=Brassica napus TaxID=3708 RepID=A0ABQ7YSE8_BRANA|nr:hypothetical protein HID58_078166 [Brassica napus]